MRRSLVLTLLLGAATSLPAGAATLSGTVLTADGRPLGQIPLSIAGAATTRTVFTTASGAYVAAGLAPGRYRIESLVPGFVVAESDAVAVGDADLRVDITLASTPVREHVVVAATRGEAPASTVGVTVSVLDEDRITAREALGLTALLQDLPGVVVNRSGPLGRQATVFLRGGASSHTRVLVDGVPVNEPGGFFDYGNQLGLGLGQVEVVRGAASSLYGSDALAGVIALRTRRPAPGEPMQAHVAAEAGSFEHRRYQGGASGRAGRFDWNAAVLQLGTDNEGPNSAFDEVAASLALGASLGDRWSLLVTARGSDSEHGTPGQTGFGEQDLDAFFQRTDAVLGISLRRDGPKLRHELRAGRALSDQLSVDPLDSGSYVPRFRDRTAPRPVFDFPQPDGYQNDTRRTVAGYQGEYDAGRHLLTAGIDVERESGALGTPSEDLLAPTRTNVGFYLQDRWAAAPTLYVTAGGRVERNDSFGTAFVPRVAATWLARPGADSTSLKASAGAGIKEPGFFESFGTSFFAQGNPDLQAERSRTYDLGVEQRAANGRVRVEVTAYRHDYRDQIAYRLVDPDTFRGTYVNLGETRAQGLEVELEGRIRQGLRLFGHYTFLDSEVLVSSSDFDPLLAVGRPLLRRPKHTGSVTAEASLAGGRLSAGATAVFIGARADGDFAGLDLSENEGHTRVDARVRARASRWLEVFAAAENLLDADYHEVLGFPGLGRALRVGVRLRTER